MSKLDPVLKFAEILNQFRAVERVLYVPGTKRWENDVEHSYQLAMLAWYIASSCKLSFDMNKVLRYAMVHDLVEVYAGDTYLYTDDETHRASQKSREAEAQKKLQEVFPEFDDLHEAISGYEEREDRESRFVYALDKLQPVINIYLDNGESWKEKNVSLAMVIEKKRSKGEISPEAKVYFDELLALLEDDPERFFGNKKSS